MRRRSATLIAAVIIGLTALGFAYCADQVQRGFAFFADWAGPATLVIVPAGFALLAWLTRRFAPEARGSGIPQVIAAAPRADVDRSPLVSLKTAMAKLLLTLGGLLVGASSGREGPTVQIAAALMTAMHRIARVPLTPAVVIAGGAAGVSAAFNTPLAGVTFALEELASAYEQRLALLVMAAVVIAGMVSFALVGNYAYFGALHESLALVPALLAVPVVGIIGGIAGALFSRMVLAVTPATTGLWARVKGHPVLFAAGCGLVVAAIGLVSHGLTWGTGYDPAKALVEGHAQPWWFAFAKFGATLGTTLSGIPGGIFAPSLSVGAGIGGLLAPLFPSVAPGTIVLLGMIAYFTGVVRAPLTSTVIVMEMTDSHTLVVALFATAIIAEGVAATLCRERLYHGLSKPFRS